MRVLPASLLAAVAVAVLAAPAVGALSSPGAPARLRATSLTTTGKTLTGGTRFTVAGVVRKSGGTSSRAVLDFKLRSTGRPHVLIALGRASTPKVARGGTRRFRATLRLKASSIPDRVTGPFHVVVCVRRTATDRTARCRRSTTTVTVKGPKRTATTGGGSSTTTTPATVPKPAIVPTPTPTDTTAPTTGDDVPAVYRNAPIPVTLTAADEAGGSGVGATYYTTGASPADPTAASAAYAAGSKPTLASGEVIKYRSVDVAGNLEAVRTSRAALVDTVAPVTTDDVPATVVSVVPRATLQGSDAGGSGVARTYYTVGASPAEPTTGSAVYDPAAKPVVPDGQRIRYFSVDVAGNPEAPHVSAVVQLSAPPPLPDPIAGARTVGDALFPALGNGGYDATHYDLQLTYTPVAHTLGGTSTMTATPLARLREFSLDFQGFTISAVTVDGQPAAFTRPSATKLVVTPPAILETGVPFSVAVAYSGTPPTITDPDGSDEGFLMTPDGAFVVGEPMGSMGWFPNNNHPSDKATFDSTMTVPVAFRVIGNGVLVSDTTAGTSRTVHWRETHPMATYLATSTVGLFTVTQGSFVPLAGTPALPVYDAVDTALGPTATNVPRETEAAAYFSSLWGIYPFSIIGSIVDDNPTIGYALETQTKPIYPFPPDVTTVAHEISHQWWGDSVSLTKWQDIWLNEGFADYSEKLFDERKDGGPTLKSSFDTNYAKPGADALWTVPPAAPTAANMFASQVYTRGGMTMEALHEIIGEAKMNELLGTWYAQHRDANATTAQFIALAQQVSGKNLAAFFDQWLYQVGKPTLNPSNCCA